MKWSGKTESSIDAKFDAEAKDLAGSISKGHFVPATDPLVTKFSTELQLKKQASLHCGLKIQIHPPVRCSVTFP